MTGSARMLPFGQDILMSSFGKSCRQAGIVVTSAVDPIQPFAHSVTSMNTYKLEISEDEAIVLFDMLSRFDETDELSVQDAAEYAAITRLHAQIDKTTAAMFDPKYSQLLKEAKGRLAERVGNTWRGEK